MLIPDNIDSFDSKGEQLLYLKFKNDSSMQNFYILHSVFTNFHVKNITGELDFLVLAPELGIFAIEVKHGKVSREGGTWSFVNRLGNVTNKNRSPFSQVDGTMNSIRKYILDKVAGSKQDYERFSKILFGTGVAFTSMDEFQDFGQEAHSWQILTRSSMRMPLGHYINALSRGWHDQNRGKFWYDANLSRPTDKDCKKIIQILRGDFNINYSEINRIIDNETLIEEYTKEQFHLLDFVNHNKRCLIQGQAGTGKTIMAIEVARRSLQEGKKVALFCYNKLLGEKLNESLTNLSEDKNGSFFAGTLDSFLLRNTQLAVPEDKNDLNTFYRETLPFEFLLQNENIGEGEKYDLLLLDEAQDLVSYSNMPVFDEILKGGLKEGNWVLFGDFSNQAIYLNKPDELLQTLNEKTSFIKFPPLKINCRNTKNIVNKNILLTGSEKPEFTGRTLDGENIETKFPAMARQLECVEEILNDLKNKKIPFEKITMLSPKRFENTYLSNSELVKNFLKEGLSFHTIHSFKGLENTYIILLDFADLASEDTQRLLYVGISRAKQKLYLVLNNGLEQQYKELVNLNVNKL
jgi:hypothetical protein